MADDASPGAVLAVAALAARLGRDDLSARLRAAAARVSRPATVVCVVGEFKQGKSSLVNSLLGTRACPVDDDLATSAITLVRHGDEVRVEVRRREGERAVVERITPSALRDWVTEAGNPDNRLAVERVDIALPAPLLESGLVLVDTPGMGSLGAGHAAATLAFLPFADGLVFVSDASAELSDPEADFLKRASDLCPTVVVALSKTDLHPHWERVAELDRGHLERLGSRAALVPVSAWLHGAARQRHDAGLHELSGIPQLLERLQADVVAPAKVVARQRAAHEASATLDLLGGAARAELDVLGDPAAARATMADLDEARQRLEHLKGPGARWSTLVADRLADLNNESSFRFRRSMRSLTRASEDRIEQLKTPKDWEELARDLQARVAESVADVFLAIEHGTTAIRQAVVDLLAEDAIELPPLGADRSPVDLAALWSPKEVDPKTGKLSSGLTGLRGAQSGILMFGMVSQFLPSGVAAFLALSPVTLGIGAAFAGIQLVDAHKRTVQQRRQGARQNLRQFVDDVQFEVGNELGEVLRSVQRALRDEFTERVSELQRTYADRYRRAQEAAEQGEQAAAGRRVELGSLLADVAELRAALAPEGAP